MGDWSFRLNASWIQETDGNRFLTLSCYLRYRLFLATEEDLAHPQLGH